jgi:hypothetical protein
LRLKFTWNVHRINLHLRFNWDLNLIDACATQSRNQCSIYLQKYQNKVFIWYSVRVQTASQKLYYSKAFHLCCFDVSWCIEFYFPDAGLLTRKWNMSEAVLQISSSLFPTNFWDAVCTRTLYQINTLFWLDNIGVQVRKSYSKKFFDSFKARTGLHKHQLKLSVN